MRRAVAVCALVACAWAVLAPAAEAVGLPFVDLPTAGDVASSAIDDASRAIVNMIASGVATLTNEIIKVADTVGAPQVGASNTWFTASYRRVVAVSLYLMAICAMVAVVAAGIRGRVGDMVSVVLVNVPGAVVAMMLASVGVQLALGLTDAMTAYTFKPSVDQIQTFLHEVGSTFTASDGAAGAAEATLAPGLTLIVGLFVIIAQLIILAVLIVRAALIYIVTLFLPLVLAVQVWPATRHMTRKALELLAVLILSKFAIFTCFALGAGAYTSAGAGSASPVQSAIVGLGVMAAAAFSPMLLMSIVPGITGSFGAGYPGGRMTGGGPVVRTPVQVMRSTLSGVSTVRRPGTSSSTRTHTSGRSTSTHQSAPQPPAADAAREGAHTPPSGSPHARLSAGASTVASNPTTATTVGGGAQPMPPATSIVRATSSPTPAGADTTVGAASVSAHAVGDQAQRSVPAVSAAPVEGAAPVSRDGFASVRSSKSFNLETT